MASVKTILNRSSGEYKEKGSKFIAYAIPVNTEAEAKNHIEQLRKEHFKARHICYAYRLYRDTPVEKMHDDGEPVHTAGQPIMNQIVKFNLQNVIIAVVRYFGGVLLGKGGLKRAYGRAAGLSLINATITDFNPKITINIQIPQKDYALFMHKLSQYDYKILKREFSENCTLSIEINRKDKNKLFSESRSIINSEFS